MSRFRNLAHEFAPKLPLILVRGQKSEGGYGKKISGKEVDNRGEKEEEGTGESNSWIAACTVSAAKHNEEAEPHTQMAYGLVQKLTQNCILLLIRIGRFGA